MTIFLQASSDLNTLDFDIPFSFCFVLAGGIELFTTIGIMGSVTWQVLIVGIVATISTKYLQVILATLYCNIFVNKECVL